MPNLDQRHVVSLRPEDEIRIIQHGRDKTLAISAVIDYVRDRLIEAAATLAPSVHNHVKEEINGLADDLNNLVVALANKAAAAHGHQQEDVVGLQAALNNIGKAVQGVTVLANAYPVMKTATVSGGNAVFHLTDDGTAGGEALFPNGPALPSLMLCAQDGDRPHAFGEAALSNGNKTLTVPVKRTGSAVTVLGISVIGAAADANGSAVKAIVWGN